MTSSSNSRLAGLDTLRTCAIVWVILFHLQGVLPAAWQPVGGMGWLGVDLFFVLSGYLIGSQLLRGVAIHRRLNVLDFYRRRAYRILPVYLVVVVLYLFVPQWREAPNLPAAWKLLTFTANLSMNYPAEMAFSHVWSLCMEEHFYLLLPLVVLLLARIRSAALVVTAFITLFATGIGIRWWMFHYVILATPENDQWIPMMTRIYYPTYSRLDGLMSGLALAALRLYRPAWWNRMAAHGNALLLTGLLVLLGGMATFHFDYPSTDSPAGLIIGFTVVSIGFALCVAAAVCPGSILTRRIPGAQTIATLAFSLYLTHKSVAHLDRLLMPWMRDNRGLLAACVYAATCLAVAAALYITIERTFLQLRDHGKGAARASQEARIDPAL
jgi:peptidoglycan/LPS O-acetylase OafA/YrhL